MDIYSIDDSFDDSTLGNHTRIHIGIGIGIV